MSMVHIIKRYSYPDGTVTAQSHLLQQMQMAFSVRLLLLLSSLFLVPECLLAQTTDDGKLAVGASLSATAGNSSSWLSPSGDFAFGFRQLENSDLFLLSVWYAKIPDRTIVWYANGDSPAVVAKGSVVNLTADSGLVLTSPQGVELWKSESISGVVAFGVLNDTGNFVLQDDNSESLWETFNNPTHTILPGQDIEKGGKLWSQQSETNFTKGRFQLRMRDDGNLVLVTVNLPTEFANNPYYESATNGDTNISTAGTKLEFNISGYLYVLRENGEKFNIKDAVTVSARSSYLRATLNFYGVFELYSYPRSSPGNVSWSRVWSVPDNICKMLVDAGLGVCGYNSICTLRNQRPTCECPDRYSLLDPNDPYGNCKPDFIQGCQEDGLTVTKDLYEVQVLTNTDWPTSDYMQLYPSTAEICNESCFGDCLCAVAIYRADTCWKKKLPLSNGRVDTGLNSRAFIKVRKGNFTLPVPPLPYPEDKKRKNQTTLIRVGSALLGSSVFANLMLSAIVCLGFFFIYRKKHVRSNQYVLDSNLRSFSYEELKEATNGFTEELGKGAFGVVYKGILQIGSGVPVAVKKLNFVVQDSEKEFKTELNIIGQTHHKNLVRLVGYCDEGQERLLVYELLSNGTLANFLFSDTKPSWRQRIDIAYGVAKGLLYLHEECSTQIIHCDIKPQNILLDDYCNARIADFGLAKLLMMNQSQTQTAIRGTKGYVAPEWFRNMPITTKVDVYSFGVVLLECICCRRSVDMENVSEESAILTDWVYDCYLEGALDAVVDYEVEALHEKTKLERLVMVALWCIQENPSLRPTMKKVIQMLEGLVEVHAPPCPSPYNRAS
uniref:G-type lectin S-receptor-like serine/threonine-protein kinase RLK1 n=1 Tax=Fragaria vesca subsp. vesca TaxID=101020 RepID=UPI0005C80F34|nr:PREDICTED: G-type lectin S-receptor-like serine/threonine-protein kinase RLK1 [Fragaria vesca subsp. vesca]XP_011470814.1 PREDICTED: G-type lectin S-receptor-like serine/threonine-protein kinase RLK1 [Fragaria vesca subsp. vesca]